MNQKTPLGIPTDRIPLTREQIRRAHDPAKETYISPNFGDGGWHTTPGCLQYTTEWEPRNDKILVRITDINLPKTFLVIPEVARQQRTPTRTGVVLKCGPGKWVPGEWWKVNAAPPLMRGIQSLETDDTFWSAEGGLWQWIPGHRQEMQVKPGMQVLIGQWTDYETADASWGENIVLCQEADVRVILA